MAKQSEVDLRVFLMADAVRCARRGQRTPDGYDNIEPIGLRPGRPPLADSPRSQGIVGGRGSAPTAPMGTSVQVAGSCFEPATIRAAPEQIVRWIEDDTAPHTVKAERIDRRTVRMSA